MEIFEKDGKTYKKVFTKSIRKNGKVIYHPKGGVFVFTVEIK
ncbi:hypothetical protein [Chryseobacterium sp. BIGb0232]|jgi:hypothetical protein|nr:hypothetical protein [Chryseobacterium sp. BIGb0232]MCS4301819.1 hypothetical protein [Chryseobacterium sp. BIGb0232]ROS19329.1 hypothetical protein EDF65_0012 [Chryseobacterium nakagawai]